MKRRRRRRNPSGGRVLTGLVGIVAGYLVGEGIDRVLTPESQSEYQNSARFIGAGIGGAVGLLLGGS